MQARSSALIAVAAMGGGTLSVCLLLGQRPPQEVRSKLAQNRNVAVYTDKNSFLSFVPPDGWNRKDFPEDPRSKVEFHHAMAQGVFTRLIAAAAPTHMNSANFVALMRQDMETLRNRIGPRLTEVIVAQRPAFASSALEECEATPPPMLARLFSGFCSVRPLLYSSRRITPGGL